MWVIRERHNLESTGVILEERFSEKVLEFVHFIDSEIQNQRLLNEGRSITQPIRSLAALLWLTSEHFLAWCVLGRSYRVLRGKGDRKIMIRPVVCVQRMLHTFIKIKPWQSFSFSSLPRYQIGARYQLILKVKWSGAKNAIRTSLIITK